MSLRAKFGELELPATADFHVHLRDGAMMEAVAPTIRQGGVNVAYVMPNLVPPITTVEAALSYQARLQALEPDVTFLMTLYLHPSITADTIREAKRAGLLGVKSYPAGVTTNSDEGTVSYEAYYPVLAEMERQDIVLNLHGELPSSAPSASTDSHDPVTILNAESRFLPTLHTLHERFPKLRIVLEHCTTADALSAVRACGPTVVATITAHHLLLTIDDVAGDPFSFCKPVAKLPTDRLALLQAAVSGDPKFFLGTDSAPHPEEKKRGVTSMTPGPEGLEATDQKPPAGVFTQPYATQLVLKALEEAVEKGVLREEQVTREILEGFLGTFGRRFYRLEGLAQEKIVLSSEGGETIPRVLEGPSGKSSGDGRGVRIVNFASGKSIWSLKWK